MKTTDLISDARLGWRQVRKNPRLYLLLALILVLGNGATTAMFSVASALLLRPLPYRDPEQLLALWGLQQRLDEVSGPKTPEPGLVPPEYVADWAANAETLERVCAVNQWLYALARPEHPTQIAVGARVTGDCFPMLGVQPLLGRLIGPDDDRPGRPLSVVLSASRWRSQFDADPDIVGQTLLFGSRPATVIGVAPDGFAILHPMLQPVELWMPRAASPTDALGQGDELFQWYALGRRRPEASLADVQAELSRLVAARARRLSGDPRDVWVQELRPALVGDAKAPLTIRFGAVSLVLLTICANVACLLLIRARARSAEFALRAAFGATRARLFRQVLTETLVLFVLAWPLSALIAAWLVSVFRELSVEPQMPLAQVQVQLDWRAWLFCLAASLGSGLLSGWIPSLAASRTDLLGVLRQAGSGASTPLNSRWQPALVVAQVALAFALSTSGGLALSALLSTLAIPAGFDPQGLVSAHLVGFSDLYAADAARAKQSLASVLESVRATAGVQSVAANTALPLSGYEVQFEIEIQDRAIPAGVPRLAEWNWVTPGYFETMHIPIRQGRGVLPSDTNDAPRVVMVSQGLAERYFPGESPIGHFLRVTSYGSDRFREIVGIVGDVRRNGLGNPIEPEVYSPLDQDPGTAVIVARTNDVDRLGKALPALVAAVEPSLGVRTEQLQRRMRGTLRESYRISTVLGAFAAVALVLASLALYALVSQTTALRTRELGIRTALGSPPSRLIWLILRGGLTWLALGGATGLTAAWAIAHWLLGGVSGMRVFEPRVYGCVLLALGTAGLLASLLPAWRATRLSISAALKHE